MLEHQRYDAAENDRIQHDRLPLLRGQRPGLAILHRQGVL